MSVWLIKSCYDLIADKLINIIINCSLKVGEIPNKLKTATVIPIQKIAKSKKY